MPPAPRGERISYEPSRVPAGSVMSDAAFYVPVLRFRIDIVRRPEDIE